MTVSFSLLAQLNAHLSRSLNTWPIMSFPFLLVAVGKVNEVRLASNCKTAWYSVNVTYALRGNVSSGDVISMKARLQRNCLCPILQPDETYFFAIRSSSQLANAHCQTSKRGNETICPLKHRDIVERLPDGWPVSSSRKEFRKILNGQGFPRWFIRVAIDL